MTLIELKLIEGVTEPMNSASPIKKFLGGEVCYYWGQSFLLKILNKGYDFFVVMLF
jgi:hypothetical protein